MSSTMAAEGLDSGKIVWAPHLTEGYQLGRIVDLGTDTITVEPLDTPGKTVTDVYERVFPAEENSKEVEDNCSLMYLNEATLLHNIRMRYKKGRIYTYVANILLAVNPYHEMKGLYSSDTIRKYMGKSLGVLPPHVFAIADKAFREMRSLKLNQSIIISGESGAGKTESTKYVLRFLTELYGASAGIIEQRIVEANPLLESFGNAKTMRNTNSSRFGKFIEIHYNKRFQVVGGFVSHYLLEKSRICGQMAEERNYHAFYRLIAGAPDDLRATLGLDPKASYAYLNQKSRNDPSLDDVTGFRMMVASMDSVGMTTEEKMDLMQLTAAILHLGNITFEEYNKENKEMSTISRSSARSFSLACKMLKLEEEDLQRALVSRVMTTSKGGAMGTIINIPLKKEQAANARDALAKALYLRMFDWIVGRVNKCFPFDSSDYYIGVLDIAGFEYFQENSFEQFCINYCNEKLQQFFNRRILKEEQELYRREGLGVGAVEYVDNQDCIDLFELKGVGILDLLDEECKLPKGSNQHFATVIHRHHSKHFRLMLPRKSKFNNSRNLRDDEAFIVRHFAGAVCYQVQGFLDKNNDALHDSLEVAISQSQHLFVRSLFPESVDQGVPGTKKLTLISVGSKFRTQLNDLMAKLKATGASFIRCLKPNMSMESHHFIGGQILSQLQCAGMVSVLQLMQGGFPSRAHFSDLYHMYKEVLPEKLARLDPRTFSRALFRAVGMDERDFCFGMSKVFFKAGKFAEFDQVMKSDPDNLSALVNQVHHWLVRQRWKKVIYGAVSVQKLANKIQYRNANAVILQKNVRMYFAQKKHRPRYLGLKKLQRLKEQTSMLWEIAGSLKKERDVLMKRVKELQDQIDLEMGALKEKVVDASAIENTHTKLVKQVEVFLSELKEREQAQIAEEKEAERLRKLKEEQERLRKIQEEMEREKERERKRKEEEERRRRQEEEERRIKAEMEARRKREEEEARRIQEEEEARRKEEEEKERLRQLQLKEEEERKRAQEEQERRDYELALRLAQDESQAQTSIQVASVARPMESRIARRSLRRSDQYASKQHEAVRKKYDLSKWKYAELRDTINTSVDIELLEACRDEFHRRLKVYHAWKMQNRAQKKTAETQRMPASVQQEAAQNPPTPPTRKHSLSPLASPPPEPPPSQQQRYFRVPFIRPDPPGQTSLNKKKGWWFAHFEGQWVVRQLELHPDREPLLLVAGVDDMRMCELSLDETGLTRKRGAEILECEFNQVWGRFGGKPFRVSSQRGQ